MAYLIADGLILAVLLLSSPWWATHRGFILSPCGLLAVLAAFVGASFCRPHPLPHGGGCLRAQIRLGHRGTAQRLHPAPKWRRRAPLPCPPTTCLWTGY